MKQKMLVLGVMLSCLLGLSACGFTGAGSQEKENSVAGSRYSEQRFNQQSLSRLAQQVEDYEFEYWYVNGVTPDNFEQLLYENIAMNTSDEYYEVLAKGYDSWYKAIEDIGYTDIQSLPDEVKVTETNFEINKDGQLVATSIIEGTQRKAEMVIYYTNRAMETEIGVTVMRSMPEKLENAGLNTLLGMGMAFAILIFISLIISLFPILFGGSKKKKPSDKEIAQKAMDNTISQIAEQEDLSSDAELVAVIAAAIAAYEGSGSTDGFRVRSIRKVNKNWKKY